MAALQGTAIVVEVGSEQGLNAGLSRRFAAKRTTSLFRGARKRSLPALFAA